MMKNIVLNFLFRDSSTMVGHLPHHPKVKGLRSASVIGKGGE
jgi:hypothetical protein